MLHICRTIRQHFSLRQVKLCIGQRKYKQKFTTQGRINRPSEWIRARSLKSYFAFCKIVVKTNYFAQLRNKKQCSIVQTSTSYTNMNTAKSMNMLMIFNCWWELCNCFNPEFSDRYLSYCNNKVYLPQNVQELKEKPITSLHYILKSSAQLFKFQLPTPTWSRLKAWTCWCSRWSWTFLHLMGFKLFLFLNFPYDIWQPITAECTYHCKT